MNYPSYKITKSIASGYADKPFEVWFNDLGCYHFTTEQEARDFADERQGKAKYSVFVFAYGMKPETCYFHNYEDASQLAAEVGASIAVLGPVAKSDGGKALQARDKFWQS